VAKKDPRVDAYIAKSAEFAKPILSHLRKLVHAACPEAEETVKWGMPFFDYKGPLANMASFKAHCAFGFWKGKLILDKDIPESAMGQFGRLTSLADLPKDKALIGYIKAAARLNEEGVKSPTRGKAAKPKPKLEVPAYFTATLKKDKKALAGFASLTPSQRNEYVEWVTEAKTEETRAKRLATSVEWISEGKIRNWKYVK
jgi:uncharacterized protein YdeI (YjbR/CyaY-like superfamily)